jgi:hypothetical protein
MSQLSSRSTERAPSRELTERRLKTYTFLCVRTDGGIPAMELSLWADETAAHIRAEQLLAEHGTCSAVEIWDDEALCASISRQSTGL